MFRVKQAMTQVVVTISPQQSMKEAADLLVKHGVSGLPVVEGEKLVGVLSEFDLLKLVYNPEMDEHKVQDYMSKNLKTVKPETTLVEVTDFFLNHAIRRLPVVEGEKLVGIISRHDIIRFVTKVRKMTPAELSHAH